MGQDFLAKIRALSETADSYEEQASKAPTQERREELMGAAANYRAKAEQLMKQFRIDQEDVLAKDATAFEPVVVDIDVCRAYDNPYRQQYINMMWRSVTHVGAQAVYEFGRNAAGERRVIAKVVGYEDDVRYAEMLYTAAALVFADRLEPKVRADLSDQVNAYRLRAAGIERVRASEMLWGRRDPGKIGRLYLAECKVRGETPALTGRGVTGATYRQQYAEEFDYTYGVRLLRARNAADSVGGGLVLHGRDQRVKDAFYKHFPYMKPSTEVAEIQECEDCKKAKNGRCRNCQKVDTAVRKDQERRTRAYHSTAGRAGRASGRDAANHIDLTRSDAAKRLNEASDTTSSKEIGS